MASGSPNSYEYKSEERCGIPGHKMNEIFAKLTLMVMWKIRLRERLNGVKMIRIVS